jgi:hypothetical protein
MKEIMLNILINHKKYGRTFLKCTLFIDSGTVLNILNYFYPLSLIYMMAAKLLHL